MKKIPLIIFCIMLFFSTIYGAMANLPLAWMDSLPEFKYDEELAEVFRYSDKAKKENIKIKKKQIKAKKKVLDTIGNCGKIRPPIDVPEFGILDIAFEKGFLKEILLLDSEKKYESESELVDDIRHAFFYNEKKSPNKWRDMIRKNRGYKMKIRDERDNRIAKFKTYILLRSLFYANLIQGELKKLNLLNATLFSVVDPHIEQMLEGLSFGDGSGSVNKEDMEAGMPFASNTFGGENSEYQKYISGMSKEEMTAIGEAYKSGDGKGEEFLKGKISNLTPDKQKEILSGFSDSSGNDDKKFGNFLSKIAGDETFFNGMQKALEQTIELSEKYGFSKNKLTIRKMENRAIAIKQVQAMYLDYLNLMAAFMSAINSISEISHSNIFNDPFMGVSTKVSTNKLEKMFVKKEKKIDGGFLAVVLPKINLADNSVLFAEQKRKENRRALRKKRLKLAALEGFK